MANNNKHTGPNVPALRFPEFSGEWIESKLGDIADFSKGAGISKDQRSGKGNPCILYGELYTRYKSEVITNVFSKTALPDSNLVKSKANDIIIPASGETAEDIATARCVPFDNILLGGDLNIIRLHEQDGKFFSYQLNGVRKYDIATVAQGVSVVHLHAGDLKGITVKYPSHIAEQEKISQILGLIDDRIATQSKIIEELKTLRGALNESLYCCCESYQELSLNDVGVSYSGLSGKSGNDFGSGYPFIPYTNIFTNNIIDEGQLEYVQVREDESQNSVCFGDLLMTLSSETPEEVGIGAVYLGHESPLYLNSFAFGIHITRTDLVYPPYLSWLVSTKSFRKFILPYAQGSTRYNLQKTDFMKAKYRFPTLGRQKAISVLLSGYSSKIKNEERVLNKYTALKQGLIEQLFI